MDFCGNVVLLGISYCCCCCNNVDYHQKLTTSSTVNGLGCHQDEVVSCSNCRQLRWLTLVSVSLCYFLVQHEESFPFAPTPHTVCVPALQLFPLFLWLNAWPLLASRHFDVRWLWLGVSEAAMGRLSSPLHPRRPSEGFELHAVLGYFLRLYATLKYRS